MHTHGKNAFPPIFFDPHTQQLFLRVSVCTGERTLCLREKSTGHVTVLALVESDRQLQELLAPLSLAPGSLKKEY